MSDALTLPSKVSYVLIRLTYGGTGNLQYKAYTNWTSQLPGNPIFESVPTMEVTAPENTGVLDAKTLTLEMPLDSLLTSMSSGEAFSAVFVEATEVILPIESGPAGINRKFFRGRLQKTIRNPGGKSNRVKLEFKSPKGLLEVPMGIPANHHCPWTLFKGGCGVVEASHTVNLTVSSVDGKVVTVSSDPGKTGNYFHRGFARYQGQRVGIQYWSNSAPTTFHMIRTPSSDWEGNLVGFFAGCDKTIETCRARFNAEDYFAGIGYAIPAYNPNLEDPE